VRRAYAWGKRKKYVRHSPVDDLEDKPKRRRREVVYTPDQWDKILVCVKDQCFRDLLESMAETGCRPKEARCLEARHIDLKNEVAVYQPSETKTDSYRVIFLTDKTKEICQRLCELHFFSHAFRHWISFKVLVALSAQVVPNVEKKKSSKGDRL